MLLRVGWLCHILSFAEGSEPAVVLILCLFNSQWRRIVLHTDDVAGLEAAANIEDFVVALESPVSYTHLTLPTKRIV